MARGNAVQNPNPARGTPDLPETIAKCETYAACDLESPDSRASSSSGLLPGFSTP
jgi:hypothetical protein